MAKNEKPPLYMIRKGSSLLPEMQVDAEAIWLIPEGQRVKVSLTEHRNTQRLRAYWSILGEVVKATGCAPTPEALHELVKLETGHTIKLRLGNGMKVELPGSIAFDKITESEMAAFFQAAEQFLASEYGWVKQEQAA